nr:ribosomal protein S14 [Cuscuta australis]WDY31149.1 ribosomal protein S14 [Cuscuta campestris]WKF19598.1 ribosomal protein S14 [Cuscuta gronovii]
MSEKQNIRDHKRRLLAELRRKLYKAFPYLPSDMRDKHRYKVLSCPSCQERKPMYFHGSPSFRI